MSTKNVKIKICGLTDPLEAEYLNRYHVDYAGMVLFYPKSKRNISIEKAGLIKAKLDLGIRSVAVTVSPDPDMIRAICRAGFDLIQIHGAMPESFPPDVSLPVFKAFNVDDLPMLGRYTGDERIEGFVMDAATPGSGRTFDWDLIRGLDLNGRSLILAGGLNPSNIIEAADYVHPDVVDVSSGVEYDDRPGKDPQKIASFVQAVRDR